MTVDGRYVVSGGDDSTLRVWDVATGIQLAYLPMAGWVLCVAAHPRQPRVVFGDIMESVFQADLVALPALRKFFKVCSDRGLGLIGWS